MQVRPAIEILREMATFRGQGFRGTVRLLRLQEEAMQRLSLIDRRKIPKAPEAGK